MSAKKELLRCVLNEICLKSCSSSFRENNDEDLKVIDVNPIESLFSNINLDKDVLEMSRL